MAQPMNSNGNYGPDSPDWEIITDDPSTLSDYYLEIVRQRLASGNARGSDWKYIIEAYKRAGRYNEMIDNSFILLRFDMTIDANPVGIIKYYHYTNHVELIIDTYNVDGERLIQGDEVFNRLIKVVKEHGGEINEIHAEWTEKMPGNLKQFNKYLRDNPNATKEEAAWETFTGRMAREHGFDKVRFEEDPEGERGEHTEVRPIFYKEDSDGNVYIFNND